MLKRMICVCLAALMLLSLSTVAFAKADYSDMTLREAVVSNKTDYSAMTAQEVSKATGMTVEEVKGLRSRCPDDAAFNAEIVHFLWALAPPSSAATRGSMNSTAWDSLENSLQPGDILLTKDSESFGYYHGHAAIISSEEADHLDENDQPVPYSIEALAYKIMSSPSDYSDEYEVSWWRDFFSYCRVYRPDATSYMPLAGAEAHDNLVGIYYNFQPPRNSPYAVNCATLVWQAYDNVGYNIDSLWLDTMTLYPRDLVASPDLTLVRHIGWPGTAW